MWTALILLLLVCGAIALWDAPDRARRHAAERRSVLDALASLRRAGTASSIAREITRRTGSRPPGRVVHGHLAALEEEGLIAIGQPGSAERAEPHYLLLAELPPEAEILTDETPGPLIVYHDGACPLCAAEIAHYRRARGARTLRFVDVSEPGAAPGPDLKPQAALARFHVRDREGALLSGASAFVALWQALPGWRWLGRIVGAKPVLPLAEAAYRGFLPLRPWLARWLVAVGVLAPGGSRPATRRGGR